MSEINLLSLYITQPQVFCDDNRKCTNKEFVQGQRADGWWRQEGKLSLKSGVLTV
jgi:hypothetical protein